MVLRILDGENRLVERVDQKSIPLLSVLGVFVVFSVVYDRIIPTNLLTGRLYSLYLLFTLLPIIILIMVIRLGIRKEPDETNGKGDVLYCDPAFLYRYLQFSQRFCLQRVSWR